MHVNTRVVWIGAWLLASSAAGQTVRLQGLRAKVQVHFDASGVPHVFAEQMTDACRAIGYLHATDRLWEMDLFRRLGSGTTAEILGTDGLASDILVRRLGIRRGCEAVWSSADLPRAFRAELEAYAAGVNAKIAALGEEGLPRMFEALEYRPAPWTPVDSLVFLKYMGWDQSGTDDDLWFGMIVEKMGTTAVEELWPLDRPYEIPTVKVQVDRRASLSASLAPIRGAAPAYEAAMRAFSAVGWLGRTDHFGSNNWAVDGTKTASGKPMLCSDPHLGFRLPSIWYTVHLSAGGLNLAGVTFPSAPFIVIGHNDHLGWGITNMQADAVDYFVETIHPDDPMKYKHRGKWKKIGRITEKIPVRGQDPHVLHVDSTVHGPIISREGKTIAMQWTGLGPTCDALGFWEISRARNLKAFLKGLDRVIVPALNIVYADAAGNIAIHPCGALPLRTRGQGRIPMDGASGDHDWTGMIPRDELPLAVNPAEHFVASANGRPASVGYPHYLGWMWDPSYRTRRIHEMLSKADKLTVETMMVIQNDAHDKAAEVFVPVLLSALKRGGVRDAFSRRVIRELEGWDFVADLDATGPVIWLRWFQHYRAAVWDDEWEPRGIEKKAGSWGFTGINRREPMLEVLEYITREHPGSIWFDDRGTPQRESRDEIMLRSFEAAVASLRKQFGDDIRQWAWKHINVLRISSLSRQDAMARTGGPVPGTCFTVNPGSNIGHVGGGASWRMIVDFARPSGSVGVYPGGQSEDPTSELYDDQMTPWAAGRYLGLNAFADAAELPATARTRSVTFVP